MSLFEVDIDGITEEHLKSLCRDQVEESLTLEFKRQLNLSDREEKAEAAKDVSAMANTAGGRILYGIEEKVLPDGSKVADSICPLTDGAIDSRLTDILLSSIHPRPWFLRTRKVPVSNPTGFVLVVEVRSPYSRDLHMVTGFKDHRFYRRAEQRTVLMTEPEIREAYVRIAASRQALEASMEKAISAELELVPSTQKSVLIVPWYGHRDLVNPQRLGAAFGSEVAHAVRPNGLCAYLLPALRVAAEGYRAFQPSSEPLQRCTQYLSIRRTGLVHLAHASLQERRGETARFYLNETTQDLVETLLAARYVLEKCAYWGPVRIIHRLNAAVPFYLTDPTKRPGWESLAKVRPLEAGPYIHEVPEVNLKDQGTSMKMILTELLHRIFESNREPGCPWFDASGKIAEKMRSFLPSHVFDHLTQ